MFKSFQQAKKFLQRIRGHVNRDLKNLKISPEVHKKLKLQATEEDMQISDYADLLLTLAMSEMTEFRDARRRMIEYTKSERNT